MSKKNEIKLSAITNEILEYLIAMPEKTVTTVRTMLHECSFESLDDLECAEIAINLAKKACEAGIAMDYISHWNKDEGLIHNLDFVKRQLRYIPESCFDKLEFWLINNKDGMLEGCIDLKTATFIVRRDSEDKIFELSLNDEERITELMMKDELPSKSIDYGQDHKGSDSWKFAFYENEKESIIISGENDINIDTFNDILAILNGYK